MKSELSRREMLLSLASVGAAGLATQSRLSAQTPPYLLGAPLYPPIRVRSMNSMGLTVSDVGRSGRVVSACFRHAGAVHTGPE